MTRLGDPLVLRCGARLPNRIQKSATSEGLATDRGVPTAHHVELYRRWAAGGAGLLVTGNVMIDPCRRAARGDVALHSGSDLAPFRRWSGAVSREGAVPWMQLSHPGRQSPRSLDPRPVAPSAIPMRVGAGAFAPPRALRDDEIPEIVERFGRAAELAIEVGFAGVQLHAAHGYLLHQFLSPRTNERDDAWGGSAERRARLLLAAVRRVRSALPPTAALGVKLDVGEVEREPLLLPELVDLVRWLELAGVDALELTGGTYEEEPILVQRRRDGGEALFGPVAQQLRTVTRCAIVLTGGFRSARAMDAALASEMCDVIGTARASIVAPSWPRLALEGRPVALPDRYRRLGFDAVDAPVSLEWYRRQMERLARGDEPDPALPRLGSALSSLRRLLL